MKKTSFLTYFSPFKAHLRALLLSFVFASSAAWAQFKVDVSGVGLTQVPIAIASFKGEETAPQKTSAILLADQLRKKGETPIVVLLTDGKGNIARDGRAGRAQAATDALAAATEMRLRGFSTLLVDTSPQAQDAAKNLAQAMGAQYLALPYAGANSLNQAVRAVAGRS